ncbi:ranBP-type and C3HC4-type zinc finger-containing protein 1-like [Acipenser oxyrinchus oxyrinchus]|uniref:RanBP-type and C3HC4-type zinc finger-containing protein 1 n=1 Tax=Acipenser oxyrinchus oxyrinchus TaxID=40147 RepID=A0AAD8CRC2_ACIOX|nr:ranBP-type and C3HC4-type zinc finger-containing protein 1-like [Acipenser oxyrinchus oxyrinchus]
MASVEDSISHTSKEDKTNKAEELALTLTEAISLGDVEAANQCAGQLANLQVSVTVSVHKDAYPKDEIRMKVGVEDVQSQSTVPISMAVYSHMTIAQLKEKVNRDYGFHPSLQTWVIGKRLAKDPDTLGSHGVRRDGDTAFLYIRTAKKAQLTKELQQQEEERRLLGEIYTAVNGTLEARGAATLTPKKEQEVLVLAPDPAVALKPPKPAPPPLKPKPKVGWECPQCTFLNKPTRPGCEICASDRPAGYQIPVQYQPDKEEKQRLQSEEMAMLLYQETMELQKVQNFQSLLDTDLLSLVPNSEELDCPVCFSTIEPGEGVTLRECLHSVCRECLKGTIINSMDPEVACPYADHEYTCDGKLQDREIKSLLSQQEYQRFLDLRLNIAENRSENSYHCKTADCQGWCIFEDEVNEFLCPLCNKHNCLLCKAIHEGMNCKEYQDDLRIRSENDIAARQTTEMLKTLVENGEAMHCPRCKIIVQKKDGCDWICCVMCKTEICWVTRGPRWGPNGNGDTSGGCGCRFNVARCHPNCQNCH